VQKSALNFRKNAGSIAAGALRRRTMIGVAKVEAIEYGDRKVYSVAAFNRGVAGWLQRLPTVWVEGEISELRRQPGWQTVFFTLREVDGEACVEAAMPRVRFDALRLDLRSGERVHCFGRPQLWERRGEMRLSVLSIERFGLGEHLAALERLRQKLAAEGLFAAERKRALPRLPRRIGLVTGNDAAAKRDVITAVTARYPPARLLVAETLVQGPRAARAIADALAAVSAEPGVDVIVLARGGGSFEDLLPFSDERLVRSVASCPIPVVSAVGHEQDTPLCDLAADVRASTPTAAARLVVPDLEELTRSLERDRQRLRRGVTLLLERRVETLDREADRLRRAARLLVERRRTAVEHAAARLRALSPRATLDRGYAIVRKGEEVVRSAAELTASDRVDVQLATGSFGARVEDISS
jgi:exodeoxyribonuclease VII large subunit